MRKKFQTPFLKTFLVGVLGGLLLALPGIGIGYWLARMNDPSGWRDFADMLAGAIYGYGLGVGFAAFWLHRKPDAPRAFSRSVLGSLSGLFFVIFFSAPLHLDFFPPLMWGLLVILPPALAAWLNQRAEKGARHG